MRTFARLFGVLCGAVVIAIAARYGYKTSDNDFDGYIWAFTYGSVTLGGLFGHSLALRVWRHNKLIGAIVMAVSALALVISLSNSLGAMAGRGNEQQAERMRVADTVRDLRRGLDRAETERKDLKFDAADEAAVNAARAKATAATAAKEAECKLRGPRCRDNETEESAALAALETATKNKAATDRAAKLDADIATFRATIEKAGPVLEANSQGNALARLFNLPEAKAATLSTYQNLAMAMVIELLIVISLVASEVLEHHETKSPAQADASELRGAAVVQLATKQTVDLVSAREEMESDKVQPLLERPKPVRQVTSQREPFGNVIDIVARVMEPCAGSKVELKEAYFAYAEACKEQGKKPFPPAKFASEIKRFCEEARVKIHAEEHGVYLSNVRLKSMNLRSERHEPMRNL